MENFRTFKIAVEFYRQCKPLCLPRILRDQLDRAASSIALNLMEGRGRGSKKDQIRFFQIAFGSVRECQAILTLADLTQSVCWGTLDSLAAHLYKLIKNGG